MSIIPSYLTRVSTTLSNNVTTQSLNQTQQQLLKIQNQLSTGLKISTPSDDPGSASIIMQLQKALESQQGYLSNITAASNQMSQVDTTIGSVTDLLQQAQSIASANVGSDVTQDARNGAATVINSIYSQMLTLGNQQLSNGMYMFAGDAGNSAPFVESLGGIQFVGSSSQLSNSFDASSVISFTTGASDVFGQVAATIPGATVTPRLTTDTQLSDLGGANGYGIRSGSIVLSDGTTSKTIDLTGAKSVGDVITRINAAGVGSITAGIDASGSAIELTTTGGDNITVNDVGAGTAASDLGILRKVGAGAGAPLTGTSVNAKVTALTQLNSLNGGSLDLSSGIVITNGSKSATLDFSTDTTVQDMINRINNSGTGVKAQINASGTGIDIQNTVEGTALTIGENGGTTASQLGFRTMTDTTSLASLNGGQGLHLGSGGPSLRITRSDGVNIDVTLPASGTINDVLNAINTAAGGVGGGMTASLASNGNGIVLTDSAGGGGQVTVSSLNGSDAAADLGLTGTAVGGVVTGADVNPIYASGVFTHLANLRDALQKGDQAGITAAAAALQADYTQAVQARGVNGAKMQDLDNRQTRIQDQNTATQSALSSLQDVDYTSAITQFQTLQTALQAALQSAGKVLNLSLMDFLS